jgi:D-serine deaminase-like pyridoxal phosphate-dependent protein
MLSWDAARSMLKDESLPALLVDRDAFDRNVRAARAKAEAASKPLRVATKSVRSLALIDRALSIGAPHLRGLLAFSVDEAVLLAGRGHEDVLVAYPTLERRAIESVAARAPQAITLMVDELAHVEAVQSVASARGVKLKVAIEIDVSFRPRVRGDVHLGPRRSPLRDATSVLALARSIATRPSLELVALMGYEAHIASVDDTSIAMRAFKRVAWPRVIELRASIVDALRRASLLPSIVNGGGSGSVAATLSDPSVTEGTIGSGLLCAHLFDGFARDPYEPAIFIALETCRVPDASHVTCRGGGYVASGPPALDRLPAPVLPPDLRYLEREGAGEVQTPLDVTRATRVPEAGDPVLFRPSKSGEIAERFREHVLFSGDRILDRKPTYRGEGWCFF